MYRDRQDPNRENLIKQYNLDLTSKLFNHTRKIKSLTSTNKIDNHNFEFETNYPIKIEADINILEK